MTFYDIAVPLIALALSGLAILYARHSAAQLARAEATNRRSK